MKKIKHLCVLLALAVLQVPASWADDIDLFVGSNPSAADLPNVLFIIDNTANWNQAFTNEMAALASTFQNMPTDKFRVGMMLSTETGGNDNNINGGYVRAAIRQMSANNKTIYKTLIQNFDKLNDKGNGGASGLTMAEAYFYFSGGTPNSGNQKAKTDYTGNTCSVCNTTATQQAANTAVTSLAGNALPSKNATTYNSPIPLGSCAKNYIIYISNGPNQENSSADTSANAFLAAAGGDTSVIPVTPNGSQANPSDEWARFMKSSPLAVTTYTIDVDPGTSGQGPGWTALLKSMASVSNGKYTAVSSSTGGGSQISDAVNKALSEIQSVNSVFASVSLPVSVSTQGTYLNQVFIGMFRPDPDAYPRWAGNLKQYKLGLSSSVLKLQDADGNTAVNSSTGFITECARSFWTPTTADSYWSFKPQGACIPPTGSSVDLYKNSNFPDGNIVEKGAEAYRRRQSTTRVLKTCSPTFASCTSLTDFSLSNTAITQTLLGAASSSEHDDIINWATGLDVLDENSNGVTTTEVRPSVHGDIVHSRPVAINFGTDAAPQVVVFYGGNDGIFRAVNGNRAGSIGSAAPGDELWAFMPPEFWGSIKRIKDNSTQVSYPNITGGAPKPYGMDGAVTAYNSGSNAWIYSTMRRGGYALYAFNVDTTNPANITLKWKVGCPDNTASSCTTGFSGIGQTWSAPKIALAAGYGAGASPLLLMGGGYDPCEDTDSQTCTASTKGNKVYVLDANTGVLQATFNTIRAVSADIVVVPDTTTGLAKYAYVVDLGGNIYRINIGAAAPSAWTITQIASLGCATPTACTDNRKFMFAPDITIDPDDNSAYDLLLGSGDREKPLISYSHASGVSNYFFKIKDNPTATNWLTSENSNCSANVICLASLTAIPAGSTTAPSSTTLAASKGWYLGLAPTEQVVTSAITIFGVVSFSTFQPEPATRASCSSGLGTARAYNISAANGSGSSSKLPAGGLPPSPVAGLVTLDNGALTAFCIGCSSISPLEATQPTVPVGVKPVEPKGRTFWYIER